MLAGIRVLDLTRVIAGPYCTALLGDLGAEIVKVERPGRGDDLRGMHAEHGLSAVFASVNRNKRGVAIDLQHPEGAALAVALARRADVVVENFLPGVAERLGLGYEAVRAENPAVIYLSLTGFGQGGPYAKRPAYNVIAQGLSGIMAVTGPKGGPPTRVGGTAADVATAYMAFAAINAALFHRARTGQGQYLDVSLLAATLGLMPDVAANYLDTGQAPGREGNENPHLAPAEVFRTADGYLAIVVMNPEQWERLCRVLGDEELRTAPRFGSNSLRLANRAEMFERIQAVLAGGPTADWIARFEAATVPAGPVYEFDQVFADPHVRQAELVVELDQPGRGRVRLLRTPFNSTALPPMAPGPAPLLGQHTAEVLGELGLGPDEIDRLAALGAIQLG